MGNHLLEGTFVDLKKPFAVLKKEGGREGGSGEGNEEGRREERHGGSDDNGGQQQQQRQQQRELHNSSGSDNTRYKVVGVVRRKCLFKARPRALIARLI